MPYPEIMIHGMRAELAQLGIEETKTSEAVIDAVKSTEGTLMSSLIQYAAVPPAVSVRALRWPSKMLRRNPIARSRYSPARTLTPLRPRAISLPVTRRHRRRSAFCGTASLSRSLNGRISKAVRRSSSHRRLSMHLTFIVQKPEQQIISFITRQT